MYKADRTAFKVFEVAFLFQSYRKFSDLGKSITKEKQRYSTKIIQLFCLFAVKWKGGESYESDEGFLGGRWLDGLMSG